jgi:hypothetical protein
MARKHVLDAHALIWYLEVTANSDKGFDARLRQWMIEQQWDFDRNDPESWREIVDRAARSMCYVLSHRILFYQAVRARHRLDELKLPICASTPQKALDYHQPLIPPIN